ncbi:MAG: hypothetical protein AAGA30_19290 [Planctomycetota bacterium]
MTIKPLTLLKTRVKTAKSTIESASSAERSGHAGLQTMALVNKLIDDVSKQYPELAESLPDQYRNISHGAEMLGKSDHTFIDLEIGIDQLMSILELIDE